MAIVDYLRKLIDMKNQLVVNLKSMNVTADENEKLNTLVPKVLECKTKQNVEFVEGTDFAGSEKSPGAFKAISKITFPYGTTTIGQYAFCNFTGLKELTIPNSVTSIGKSAFSDCTSLASVTIPNGVTSIGDYAFSHCTSLTSLTIPDSIISFENAAFFGITNLKKIIIADGSKTIPSIIPGSDLRLYFEKVFIPDSITSIREGAFSGCLKLTNVTIPYSVTSIGDLAFGQSGITSIIIPDSVTSIGDSPFWYCEKLANIYYSGTKEQWDSIAPKDLGNGMGSEVTGGTVIHYNSTNWLNIRNMIRNGTIQNYYSIGDQLPVYYNGKEVLFDIVAFDVAIPSDSNYTHSMTIMPHDCIDSLMIDNAEPNNSDSDIASKGNNRYAYSGIRQYLNSDKAAGEWWTAQHSTDTAPDYATTKAGFMSCFDSNFLSVIGKTKYRVAKNTITDGGGYEDLEDFFYLPSKMEVGLGTENGISEGALFPYFDSADKRIKNYNNSIKVGWWLRTPQNGVSYNTVVTGYSNGATYIDNSKNNHAIAPICNII